MGLSGSAEVYLLGSTHLYFLTRCVSGPHGKVHVTDPLEQPEATIFAVS